MNRRRLLATSGLALSIGLSGCISSESNSGESNPDSQLGQWLPLPATLNVERYDFRYANIPAISDYRDQFDANLVDGYEHQIGVGGPVLRHGGLTINDCDILVASKKFVVAHGDFERDEVGGSLESRGYSLATEDKTLDIYEFDGEKGTVAVGISKELVIGVGNLVIVNGEIIQMGTIPESASNSVRAILDASEDETERYTADDPYLKAVVERIGDGTAGWGFSNERIEETSIDRNEFVGEEARGLKFDIAGDTTEFSDVIVFQEGEEPPVEDVEDWLETENPFRYSAETPDYSIDVDENVVIVSGSFNTAEIVALP